MFCQSGNNPVCPPGLIWWWAAMHVTEYVSCQEDMVSLCLTCLSCCLSTEHSTSIHNLAQQISIHIKDQQVTFSLQAKYTWINLFNTIFYARVWYSFRGAENVLASNSFFSNIILLLIFYVPYKNLNSWKALLFKIVKKQQLSDHLQASLPLMHGISHHWAFPMFSCYLKKYTEQ